MKKLFYIILVLLFLVAPSALATSRAIQLNILLSGLIDPNTSLPVAAGTVEFYEAGTSNTKNVWTEKEKTNPYTTYTLSSVGTAQLYGEGEYKIIVKDSDGSTLFTWDNIRLKYPNYYIRSISDDHTQVSQDDFLLVDTTSASVTISCLAADSWDDGPLKVKRSNGSNTIVIDPDGSETINGSSTYTISDDNVYEIISDGSQLLLASSRSIIADADNDTKIQVEESTDEDKIRMDVNGTQVVLLDANATQSSQVFNSHQDADGDTKVQVEEGSDDDTVRIDCNGTQQIYWDANGTHIDDVIMSATKPPMHTIDSDESLDDDSVTYTGLEDGGRYRIEFEVTFTVSDGSDPEFRLRFGSSGGIDTGNNYAYIARQAADTAIGTPAYSSSQAFIPIRYNPDTDTGPDTFELFGTIHFGYVEGDDTAIYGYLRTYDIDRHKISIVDFEYNGASTVDRVEVSDDTTGSMQLTGGIRLIRTN